MPIRILSEALASRIAAGEVIERPASVVKELVENALDAGSTRIDVELRHGGIRSIRVVDNGRGIPAGELVVAFERFATSKIGESSDLLGIETLGFRGEALPSIASVAHVEAVTRPHTDDQGERHELEFGKALRLEAAGAPPGTSVLVTELFRNVPARLKFLGSPGAELGRIHQIVATYALAYPGVAFRLMSDGKAKLATPGGGDLSGTMAAVYNRRIADAMLALPEDEDAAFAVSGQTSDTTASRGNRNYITLVVNGRPVQSRRLTFAVEQAYHGFLAERRFPIAVLYLTVPYHDVDVNAHPAKSEVRFLREDILFAQVQRVVRAALLQKSPVPTISTGRVGRPAQGTAFPATEQRSPLGANPLWPEARLAPQAHADLAVAAADVSASATDPADAALTTEDRPTPRSTLPVLRVIGQARETYILAEGPDGVYLIDQHAAHERVLYEEIRARIRNRTPEAQSLLAPETVELPPEHAETVWQQQEALIATGFVFEPFGEDAVLLRAVPSTFARAGTGAPGEALLWILDDITEGSRADAWDERLLHSLACHGAVRAGRSMTIEESRELVRRLEQTEQPHTCPHGRPTMIHLSEGALAREFKRT